MTGRQVREARIGLQAKVLHLALKFVGHRRLLFLVFVAQLERVFVKTGLLSGNVGLFHPRHSFKVGLDGEAVVKLAAGDRFWLLDLHLHGDWGLGRAASLGVWTFLP